MEQFGVENLKKVVQFGAKLGEGVADILEDGKVELGEAAALLPQLLGGVPIQFRVMGEAIRSEGKGQNLPL